MKKFFSILLMTAVLPLFSQIIETEHFSSIIQYVDEDTLVLLDIDDTLLIPVQTLGTDVWFCHRLKEHKKTLSSMEALDKSIAEWEGIRQLTKVKIVEEGTEKIISELQSKNIPVMGLTTQGLALATCTVHQLKTLDIDLSRTAPSKEDHYFINKHGNLYREGILFTSGTPKGPSLLKLFESMQYFPKRIVFINDKATHLKDVEEAVEAKGYEFIGLRYTHSDKRVAEYNSEIAEIQWSHSSFGHILSDEEAAQIKNLFVSPK